MEKKKRKFRFFNVKGWMGYDQLKKSTSSLTDYSKELFARKKVEQTESFDEAVARMDLNDHALQQRYDLCRKYMLFFGGLAAILFLYASFLLASLDLRNAFLCFGIFAFILVQTFKQHFWMYQIKQRKLGCSFQEYWNSLVKK